MRKWIVIFTVLLLALVPAMTATSATTTESLTSLARYFPAETTMFATIRTDDAYIEELDTLLGRLNANLGGDILPPGFSVIDLLNDFSFDMTGRSFERAFGVWLGDSIAAGIVITPDALQQVEPPVLIAAEVSERESLAEFLAPLGQAGYRIEEHDGYTMYVYPAGGFLLSDDVLIFTNLSHLLVPAFEQDEVDSLAAAPNFTSSVPLLPADGYDIIAYIDYEAFDDFYLATMQMAAEIDGFVMPAASIPNPLKGAVFGFTLIDGRSLVMDVGVTVDQELLTAQPGYLEPQPVSLDFAAHVPAGAQFFSLGVGFGSQTLAMFEGLDQIGPLLQDMLPVLLSMPEVTWALEDAAYDFRYFMEDNMPLLRMYELEELADLTPEEFISQLDLSVINVGGMLRNQLNMLFAGFTGIHLEDDVLSWMTGDYAQFLRFIPVDSELGFSIDAGFITETTDSDAADYVVDRLERAATLYRLSNIRETLGESDALVLSAPLRFFFPADLREIAAATPELDFVIAADDDVFAVGSRPGAAFALTGDGASLLDDAAYAYAAETLFLDDPTGVLYIGTPSLVEALPALGNVSDPLSIQMMQYAVNQIESMTITSAGTGGQIARFTITMPENQPYTRPELPPAIAPLMPIEPPVVAVQPMEALPVLGVIATDPQFSKLNAALQTTGIDSLLFDSEAITVFAPTNDAFAALSEEFGSDADALLTNPERLAVVLNYHLVEGSVYSSDVIALLEGDGQIPTRVEGMTIWATSTPSGIMLNDRAYITMADIQAANGVIHVIDAVLLLPQ